VDGDLSRQVAACDGRGHLGDVANLPGQVLSHRIDVVREVLPHTRNAGNLRLPSELALGPDLACDAAHLRREAVQLVHHGVHGVLQLENLALHVDGDLARQVAASDGRGDLGNVADLPG